MTDARERAARVRAAVRERYAAAAQRAADGGGSGCCGAAPGSGDPMTSGLYPAEQTAGLAPAAVAVSLGCGNPTALAALQPGEVVLDLGSGGGLDVLLSARRVAPHGKAYGLDMTAEMLALARARQQQSGIANAEFLPGEIEHIPLPDASVDVIVSNCVINLTADKARVLAEAFRVLRPGGRLAVSDIVRRRSVPRALRQSLELWAGCIAGALSAAAYRRQLAAAGFTGIGVEFTRIYSAADARQFLSCPGPRAAALAAAADGAWASAFVRARKPGAGARHRATGGRRERIYQAGG